MKHFHIVKSFSVFVLLILLSGNIFSENYKIVDVQYDITGCGASFMATTQEYAVTNNVSLDKNKTFDSIEALDEYIADYSVRLNNTRAFESVNVEKQIDSENNVTLKVSLKDSFHMLAVPYGKYDSNQGFIGKLKVKDTNFLGTLNTLSADINMTIKNDGGTTEYGAGLALNYNYPFKAGIFNAEWTNDHSISYTFGDSSPEWSLKTGLSFTLPKNNHSYVLAFTQGFYHNFDYACYDDEYYFDEDIKFSVPITLFTIENWGAVKYEPYTEFLINWDTNGINSTNADLSSPVATIGHAITTSRVDWINNYRNGIDFSLSNYFAYNIQRNIVYPVISSDFKFYKGFEMFEGNCFNRIGFTGDLYSVFYLNDYNNPYFLKDGQKIGSRLRGIRDDQNYTSLDSNACKVPAAICLNFDMPYRIFQTNFTKGFFKYLNFDLQISPFVDMALTYNKATGKWFDPKDGFYAAGVEVLVYPQKFSSFTVRASLGVDIGRKLFSNYLNMDWRNNISPYELFIGIGLQY